MSLLPGKQRLNLHAIYGDFKGESDRDQIEVKHFQSWIDWAKKHETDLISIRLVFSSLCG